MHRVVADNYPNRIDQYTKELSRFLEGIESLSAGIAKTHKKSIDQVFELFVHETFGFSSSEFKDVSYENEHQFSRRINDPLVLNNVF